MIQNAITGQVVFGPPTLIGTKKISSRLSIGMMGSLMIGAILLFPSEVTWAKTTIKIVSPKNGFLVADHVPVKYTYHKEGRANHIHIFVDGNFLKATHDNPVTLTLPSGHHTIMLRAASVHHNLLNARDSVNVDVK
jgi:hypothetical protein